REKERSCEIEPEIGRFRSSATTISRERDEAHRLARLPQTPTPAQMAQAVARHAARAARPGGNAGAGGGGHRPGRGNRILSFHRPSSGARADPRLAVSLEQDRYGARHALRANPHLDSGFPARVSGRAGDPRLRPLHGPPAELGRHLPQPHHLDLPSRRYGAPALRVACHRSEGGFVLCGHHGGGGLPRIRRVPHRALVAAPLSPAPSTRRDSSAAPPRASRAYRFGAAIVTSPSLARDLRPAGAPASGSPNPTRPLA